jgi:hypothetical protein
VDGRVVVTSRIGLGAGSSRDGWNTPQDLTSRPIASEPNKESWDFDEHERDFGEKKNPPKPHANP